MVGNRATRIGAELGGKPALRRRYADGTRYVANLSLTRPVKPIQLLLRDICGPDKRASKSQLSTRGPDHLIEASARNSASHGRINASLSPLLPAGRTSEKTFDSNMRLESSW